MNAVMTVREAVDRDDAMRCEQAWAALDEVLDPEVPAVSLVELGIVRDLVETADGVEVVLTPTYSGCPATEAIEQNVRDALSRFGTVTVTMRRAPAWTTDWITDKGRDAARVAVEMAHLLQEIG